MRVLAVVLALSVTLAGLTFAQEQAPPPPASQAPAPAAPAGGAQAPGPLTQTPAPAQQPARPVPFQEGLKYAYININEVAARSRQGQDANKSIQALTQKLQQQLQETQKSIQATQQKLDTQSSVLSDNARDDLQRQLQRQQLDLQRQAEDAEREVQMLTERLQAEFSKQLDPIIDRIAREKQVHMIFNVDSSGLIWAVPGMNLTSEVIAAFDTAERAAPAASATPAAPPPASATTPAPPK